MSDQVTVKCKHGNGGSCGIVWVIGWIFTIGYLKLELVKGIYALVLWPYYLGAFFHK